MKAVIPQAKNEKEINAESPSFTSLFGGDSYSLNNIVKTKLMDRVIEVHLDDKISVFKLIGYSAREVDDLDNSLKNTDFILHLTPLQLSPIESLKKVDIETYNFIYPDDGETVVFISLNRILQNGRIELKENSDVYRK